MKRILTVIAAVIAAAAILAGCAELYIPEETGYNSGEVQRSSVETEIEPHDISDGALRKAEQSVSEDGVYVTPALVAAYLHTFNKLPSNYITKKEAEKLGWSGGDLTPYAPGYSIGGDNFGNREKLLPNGKYRECDVNYEGGRRGAERIIYDTDGDIYYTDDHYNSFTQLYEGAK